MAIGAAAVLAILALPSAAAGESVVPPGNSAATQYTETFPTPGGNAKVNSSLGGGGGGSSHGGGRSPSKVLGSHTAHQLEAHGQEGRTVATLAAESAPSAPAAGGGGRSSASGGSSGAGKGNRTAAGHHKGGAGSGAQVANAQSVSDGEGGSLSAEAPAGASGFSEVLSHATGGSSGEMGIFLPLVLLAAPLCALAYAWRRRQPGRAAS